MALSVAALVPVLDEYAHLYIEEGRDEVGSLALSESFCWRDRRPRAEWFPLPCYRSDLNRPVPDFWATNFGSGFAVGQRAYEALHDCDALDSVEFLALEADADIMPIWMLDFPRWPNVLDEQSSIYVPDLLMLAVPEFHAGRVKSHLFFRVGEAPDEHGEMTRSTNVFTPVDSDDPTANLDDLIKRYGLAGLELRTIWTEESGGLLLDKLFEPALRDADLL